MTVKELKELLEKLNEDTTILFCDPLMDFVTDLAKVEMCHEDNCMDEEDIGSYYLRAPETLSDS